MKRFSRLFLTLLVAALFIPTSANAAYVSLENSDSKLYLWGLFQPQFDWFDYDDNPPILGAVGVLSDEGPQLNPERVRFGSRFNHGAWEFGLQFNALEDGGVRARHAFISDAYGRYTFGDPLAFQAGKFKTPLGMEYNIPGNSLPMAERTMISRLVVGRTLGGMLSGRNIFGDEERGGFGYDVSFSNFSDSAAHHDALDKNALFGSPSFRPSDPNPLAPNRAGTAGGACPELMGACTGPGFNHAHGDDYAYVGRLLYNHHNRLHLEASYGVIEDAGSRNVVVRNDSGMIVNAAGVALANQEVITDAARRTETEHYEIMDIGAMYTHGPMRIRAEYADASDVLGIADNDEEVWYLEGSYRLNQMIEGVLRYQDASCDGCNNLNVATGEFNSNAEGDLSRIEFGVNLYLGQNDYNGRVQVYYAVVGDDEGAYRGLAGYGYLDADATDLYDTYRYDQFAVQLQVYY